MSIVCRRQAHSSTIPQGKAVFPILLMDVWRDDMAWCDCVEEHSWLCAVFWTNIYIYETVFE